MDKNTGQPVTQKNAIFFYGVTGLAEIYVYNEMLQKSIERQAKKIVSEGATAQDRYGHLLDAFKDRDLVQEEADKMNARISKLTDRNIR